MAEKHCKLCADCIHHGTCFREGNKKAYNGDLDISGCEYYKSAVNFVEVVRCKNCKHWEHEEDVDFVCKRHYGYRASLDFCSQGERKETTP